MSNKETIVQEALILLQADIKSTYTNQHAHVRSLISTFVIQSLDITIAKLAKWSYTCNCKKKQWLAQKVGESSAQ